MIEFKEVIEFIKKERKVFDIFEKEVQNITKLNKLITKQTGSKIFLKRYKYIDESEQTQIDIEFKSKQYSKTGKELFLDLLLRGYDKISAGEEYELSDQSMETTFSMLHHKMKTKEDKLAYLSSLYLMLFNADYIATMDQTKFYNFLKEDGFMIFLFKKTSYSDILKTKIEINDGGKSSNEALEYYTINSVRSDYLLNGNQLVNEMRTIRSFIDKEEIGYRKMEVKRYELIKNSEEFRSLLPNNTLLKVNKVINKPSLKETLDDVSNEFAIKAVIRSLPDNITEAVYKKFTKAVRARKENKTKLNENELEFVVAKILVDKYSYYKMTSLGYVGWASPAKLLSIDFKRNKKYRMLYDMEEELIVRYIKKYTLDRQIERTNVVLDFLFIFLILDNQSKERLKSIIEKTKDSSKEAVQISAPEQFEELCELYNYKDIKSGEFFKKYIPCLDKFYFSRKSEYFKAFPKETRDIMSKDYLNTLVLDETIYNKFSIIQGNEEPDRNAEMEMILEEMVELFEFQRR